MLRSTQTEGEALPVSPQRHIFALHTIYVCFFNWGNPAGWVEMRTLTVDSVTHRMAYVRNAVFKMLFPILKNVISLFLKVQPRFFLDVTYISRYRRGLDQMERHGHGVVLYRVTLVCVCVPNNSVDSIRWKPSGKAPFGLTHSHVRFFNCGNPAERVQV